MGWVCGVEKLILKLTSASTEVGVEARAELGKNNYINRKTAEEQGALLDVHPPPPSKNT